jgi:PIN domain nuclease of toxin-antitoxin system
MILLDTHVWWWSLAEPENLSTAAMEAIRLQKPAQRAIASIYIWELAMMAARRRIELDIPLADCLSRAVKDTGVTVIELSPDVAVDSCCLPGAFHKDPADRIIVATARVHGLTLVTKDQGMLMYDQVRTLW